MELEINVVDAFTDKVFAGNPAAVIITLCVLPAQLMQSIAMENNLSETAFLVLLKPGEYTIRWFSPITEITFCGHATLAAAKVIFTQQSELQAITFSAKAVGTFVVNQTSGGKIQMNFPNTKPHKVDVIPASLLAGLSIEPLEVYQNAQAYFVLCRSETELLAVERNNEILKQLAPFDVVVTCQSESAKYDFVSRYFWPANGGDEDPVTGSIHTGLAPFWAERLAKNELIAYQASSRGGVIDCTVAGDRVLISGHARHYLTGTITV